MRLRLPTLVLLFWDALRGWSRDEVPRLGASLAYYALLSLGVITVLFALIYGFLPDVRLRWGDVWLRADCAAGGGIHPGLHRSQGKAPAAHCDRQAGPPGAPHRPAGARETLSAAPSAPCEW
jgi:hypothetical protein